CTWTIDKVLSDERRTADSVRQAVSIYVVVVLNCVKDATAVSADVRPVITVYFQLNANGIPLYGTDRSSTEIRVGNAGKIGEIGCAELERGGKRDLCPKESIREARKSH